MENLRKRKNVSLIKENINANLIKDKINANLIKDKIKEPSNPRNQIHLRTSILETILKMTFQVEGPNPPDNL
jgi:hypothetical protein